MAYLHDPATEDASTSCRDRPVALATVEQIERARQGDERAWEELFTEHYPRLYRFFRARVANPEQAEDLAANVFLQAFRSIDRFTWQGKPFAAWLFGIARHELATHYRSLRPTEALVVGQHDGRVLNEFLEVEIRDILERLPTHYREALELRYVIGLNGVEAAAAMGRPHGSFRSLLHRATLAFRELSEAGASFEDDDRAKHAARCSPRRHARSGV